jgi:hypothetical protein
VVCDFCNGTPVAATYFVPVIVIAHSMADGSLRGDFRVDALDERWWRACAACRPFVDARDIEGLIARVLPLGTLPLAPEVAAGVLRALGSAVLLHRDGSDFTYPAFPGAGIGGAARKGGAA